MARTCRAVQLTLMNDLSMYQDETSFLDGCRDETTILINRFSAYELGATPRVSLHPYHPPGNATSVGARDEPEAAILQGSILQGNPNTQYSPQWLSVQKGGILVWGDYKPPTCGLGRLSPGPLPHPFLIPKLNYPFPFSQYPFPIPFTNLKFSPSGITFPIPWLSLPGS